MELSDSWSSTLLVLSMQHVSIHAQRYPASLTILQNDCNFMMPWAGVNVYTTLPRMSCSSGSFHSHLCDSMTKRKYIPTTSSMRSIGRAGCFNVKDKSSLYSV